MAKLKWDDFKRMRHIAVLSQENQKKLFDALKDEEQEKAQQKKAVK
jgi:hypothetical protein